MRKLQGPWGLERDGFGSFRQPVARSGGAAHRPAALPLPPLFRHLNLSRLRCVLPQRKMCSRSMVVLEIRSERSSERAFLEYDHVIETLATNGSNYSLDVGSLPRRAWCRQNFADARISHLLLELTAEDGIAVTQQVRGNWGIGKGLS